MNKFMAAVVAVVAVTAVASADFLPVDLSSGSATPYPSIFGSGSVTTGAGGDTYSAAPLVQDAASAFFISDIAPSTHTFDGLAEGAGNNLAGPGGTFSIIETQTSLGTTELIQVEMTALDAAGAPQLWVTATGFVAWRFDVGSNAGGTNQVDLGAPINVIASGFSAFDSLGASLGTFPLTVDSSSATAVSGVGVVGLGGADIAGFDLASIQLFWEVEVVPEPASLSLMALGALALVRRR